jgi:hypothetical protein
MERSYSNGFVFSEPSFYSPCSDKHSVGASSTATCASSNSTFFFILSRLLSMCTWRGLENLDELMVAADTFAVEESRHQPELHAGVAC